MPDFSFDTQTRTSRGRHWRRDVEHTQEIAVPDRKAAPASPVDQDLLRVLHAHTQWLNNSRIPRFAEPEPQAATPRPVGEALTEIRRPSPKPVPAPFQTSVMPVPRPVVASTPVPVPVPEPGVETAKLRPRWPQALRIPVLWSRVRGNTPSERRVHG